MTGSWQPCCGSNRGHFLSYSAAIRRRRSTGLCSAECPTLSLTWGTSLCHSRRALSLSGPHVETIHTHGGSAAAEREASGLFASLCLRLGYIRSDGATGELPLWQSSAVVKLNRRLCFSAFCNSARLPTRPTYFHGERMRCLFRHPETISRLRQSRCFEMDRTFY